MRLENIALELRRRTPWEALDLGHAMLRVWWRPLMAAWFATYWVIGCVIVCGLFLWPALAGWLLWWLKPLFDRVLLHVISRAVFAGECGVRDVLRELLRLWRGPGVLSGLTLRRLSPARSFLLPVWQLEEQRGASARARLRLLSRRYQGYGVWLTFFCANMSLVLVFATWATLLLLAPGDTAALSIWDWLNDDSAYVAGLVGNLTYMLTETLVEPLYVASGFSLYLNRRSELEGWDIEVGLRRLAERRPAAPAAAVPLLLLPALAVACVMALTASPARADTSDDLAPLAPAFEQDAAPRTAAREAIDAILADPVFGYEKDDWTWRWREQRATAPEETRADWLQPLLRVVEFLAEALRILVWIAAGVALAVLIVLLARHRERQASAAALPACGLPLAFDLGAGALPRDLAAAVRAALAAGQVVAALSLLYRGALVVLIRQRQVEFAAGDTESDCLRRATEALPAAAGNCFADIVAAWRLAAYAGRTPSLADVERLARDWDQHFGSGGRSA